MILATYFDGRTSRAHPVRLAVEAGEALLYSTDGTLLRRAPLGTLRVSERVKHAPRLITFADGAFAEIGDPAEQVALNALLHRTGHHEGWIVRAQNSWKLALGALVVMVAVLVLGYRYGLPWAAQVAARMVPQRVEAQLGRSTLAAMDERWLTPSKLPVAQQNRIRARFNALRDPGASYTYHIVFRDGVIGANAFALPGGDIIVTDALVKLVGEGDGLTGVLAHEAGHVEHQHGLRQVIQSSAIGATAALLFGDVSTILSGVPAAMLTLRYSRDYERDADRYAARLLQNNGLSVSAFADVLQALEDTHGGTRKPDSAKKADAADGDDEASAFFSSHPLTRERIDTLRRFDRTHGGSDSGDGE